MNNRQLPSSFNLKPWLNEVFVQPLFKGCRYFFGSGLDIIHIPRFNFPC